MTARRVVRDALLAAVFITAWIGALAIGSALTGGKGL